ncbi:MAG: ribosome maturation factor RimM [Candidatus Methylomirabilia bacterium]
MSGGLVPIGEIVKPQGLTGEVKVISRVENLLGQLERLPACFLVEARAGSEGAELRRVESARVHGSAVALKLEECESVEDARALVGRLVAVAESELLPLPPGTFYAQELVGLSVVTTEGAPVGTLARVEPGPTQDLWVVENHGREHLIPAVAEIVVKVDVAARIIVICPPEGLLEL